MKFIGSLSTNPNGFGDDINDAGQVCGQAVAPWGVSAFFWDKTKGMVALGAAPGAGGVAYGAQGINNLGQVTGRTSGQYAYLWDPVAGFIALGRIEGPAPTVWAYGVNDHGEVVASGKADVKDPNEKFHTAFMLDVTHGVRTLNSLLDARSTQLNTHIYWPGAINNKSQILVGTKLGEAGAYRMDPFLPGDMNCDGVVNTDDLQPFLGQMLKYMGTTPPLFDGEECGWWIGDINQDAALDENDLAPFLALVFPKADVNQR